MAAWSIPETGSVLGVDVGGSEVRRSSAVCRLDWTSTGVRWTIDRFSAAAPERDVVLARVGGGGGMLLAAAFDGPLRRGFDVIGRYRTAERMLTRRLGRRIGKPGQSSTPVGRKLNAAANHCATTVLDRCRLASAAHEHAIDERAIIEAFPTAFMGVMLADPDTIAARRGDRSDKYFVHLASDDGKGGFGALLRHLLPGRRPTSEPATVRNHDERAALVASFTALAMAAGDYVSVGDAADDGDGTIVLPPRALIRDWAWADLVANAAGEASRVLWNAASRS